MRAAKWPFRPNHITNDGERTSSDDLKKLDGVGIISNEYLQGIQTRICANLQNPTTIVEFSPHGEPVRTDSKLLFFAMHPPCRAFRECSRGKWCLRCDNRQALLFCGLGGDTAADELADRVEKSSTIREYREDTDLDFDLVVVERRPLLAYDCPLLGYRELLLPIFFENYAIATFFVGQLCLDWKLSFIRRRQAQLFRRHEDYFEEYLQDHPQATIDDIRQQVTNAHRDWVSGVSHILDTGHYEDFIRRTCRELAALEETLAEEMRWQREHHVARTVDMRIRCFRDNLPRKETTSEEKWTLLWDNVGARLTELISDFAIKYFVVFGTKGVSGEGASQLSVVAHSRELPDELRASIRTRILKFNMDKVPEGVRDEWVTSAQKEEILGGIEGWNKCDPGLSLVRLFPVPFFAQASLAVLVGYHEWNPLHSAENRPDSPLNAALQSFYTVVLSAMSSVLAATSQENMEAALRIYGHETGQLTAGLDGVCTVHLADGQAIKSLSPEKAEQVSEDIAGFVHQLVLLSRQAKMLISVRLRERTLFSPNDDFLPRWSSTYRLERNKKRLEFEVRTSECRVPEDAIVYADKDLIEQLTYNLVNNAIKYSYRGTRIYLGCCKSVLSVTNYGRKIDGEDIYELYHRGKNVSGIEGLGIGLFLARQIARVHGGEISHQSNWVCNRSRLSVRATVRERVLGGNRC